MRPVTPPTVVRGLALGLALGLGATTCPGANPPSPPDAQTRMATAVCEQRIRCRDTLGMGFRDVEHCTQIWLNYFECGVAFTNLGNTGWYQGRITVLIEPDKLDACIHDLETRACDSEQEDSICDEVLVLGGDVADNEESCDTKVCGPNLLCDRTQPVQSCPVCRPRTQPGASCSANQQCTDDHYCAEGSCSMKGSTGNTCAEDDDCLGYCIEGSCSPGLTRGRPCEEQLDRCAYFLRCNAGFCTDPAKAGDPCSTDHDCQDPGICSDGRCVFVDRCALPAPGVACHFACNSTGYCDTEVHVCRPFADTGSPCQGVHCTPDTYCGQQIDGTFTCTPQMSEGEQCSSFIQCLGFNCSDGICSEPVACTMP